MCCELSEEVMTTGEWSHRRLWTYWSFCFVISFGVISRFTEVALV